MKTSRVRRIVFLPIVFGCVGPAFSQSSTGSISGTVTDQNNAVVPGATVIGKNKLTGFLRSALTNSSGVYRLTSLPSGSYEITIEAAGFQTFRQTGITIDVGQSVTVNAVLEPGVSESVTVLDQDASTLNTSTAEVRTRFDSRRLAELPISSNRRVYDVLFSTPGVTGLATGQSATGGAASPISQSFSVNGGRTRSNNFMLDGQDMNDPTFTGAEVALNNPDAIQEVIIITNQFRAEYGRNAASIVNVVGKSGTNNYHGSLFWFHNNEHLNSCNNLDKVATGAPTGFCNKDAASDARKRAPRRNENQIGFTFGGPLILPLFGEGGDPFWKGTDKTFIFGDYQRWSDRSLVSGPTLSGAPTAAGRAVLQSVAGDRPQVQALLRSVPSGIPNGTFATFTIVGQPPQRVDLGDFTGSSRFVFDDHQGSLRLDHRFNEKNLFYARYRFDSQNSSGSGQVTPPGLTTVSESRSSALAIVLNTVLTSRSSNEARLAWLQFSSRGEAEFPLSKTIPSMSIAGLGIVGASSQGRLALGFAPGQPGGREHDTYQVTDAFSYVTGSHSMKFGVELRRTDVRLIGILNTRGTLNYLDLANFVNDKAQTATKNFVLPGGESAGFHRWHEFYAFAQDEWRIRDNLTFTFGVRYEYPGDPFSHVRELNGRILAANGNNPLFSLGRTPEADTNNLMPRVGFNWNPRTGKKGIIGFFTGGDKLVVSGGYARTYDALFMNFVANMAGTFPFVASPTLPTSGAYVAVRDTTVPDLSQANLFNRTVLSADIRSPATDQISIETQRELTKNLVMKIGYIRTRGTGLLQQIDGNPCLPLPLPK